MLFLILACILAWIAYRINTRHIALGILCAAFAGGLFLCELYIIYLGYQISVFPSGVTYNATVTYLASGDTQIAEYITYQRVTFTIIKFIVTLTGSFAFAFMIFYGYVEIMNWLKTMKIAK